MSGCGNGLPFDFQALAPADLDHRDADLLAYLEQLADLQAQLRAAKARGRLAHEKVCRLVCREVLRLEAIVVATPAHTTAGREAKALHALRNVDPQRPSAGFVGGGAVALSALFDILQAGAL